MKKNFCIFYCIVIFCCLQISGCALTTTNLPLTYKPNISKVQEAPNRVHALKVAAFQDERGENPSLIMHKINMYNDEMSGTCMAERPIADIIHDAIVDSLQKKNYKVDADSNLVLSGELINLTFKPRMGFFTGSMLANLEMNFKLINKKSNHIVWTEIFKGSGVSGSNDLIKDSFKLAVDDLIAKLLRSSEFRGSVIR